MLTDDETRRRPSRRVGARCLAAIVLAAALAGCGGKSVPAATQRADVRATIRTFMRELAAGNGQVACEGLTVGGQSSMISVVGPELGNFGIDSCAQVVQVTGSELTAKLRRELASVTVGAVKLDGAGATVPWSSIRSPAGDISSYFGHARPLELLDIHGFWYLSRF
jgi:hypothetical protein